MCKKVFIPIFVAFISLTLFTCGKYEEGPSISLRTKMSRIVGEWELESFNDGNEIIYSYLPFSDDFGDCGFQSGFDNLVKQQNVVWEIEEDNQVKQRYNRVFLKYSPDDSFISPACNIVYTLEDSVPRTDQRQWNFQNKDAEIIINGGGAGTDEYQILRLTNKELKLEDINGSVLFFKKK